MRTIEEVVEEELKALNDARKYRGVIDIKHSLNEILEIHKAEQKAHSATIDIKNLCIAIQQAYIALDKVSGEIIRVAESSESYQWSQAEKEEAMKMYLKSLVG